MRNNKNYNIGLDIGTNSVGWAIVEENNQKIFKKGGKALWGVRLFDEAVSAEDRRLKRNTRRKYERRRQRIKLLQEEFKEEIEKVDKDFYQKLYESKYHKNDTKNKTLNITDLEKKEIFNKYSTIYHLRNELMTNNEKFDIRLVYLAIHHIIKYRGNFNYNARNLNINDIDVANSLNEIFNLIIANIKPENFPDTSSEVDVNALYKTLLSNSTKNDIQKNIANILNNTPSNFSNNFAKLILGKESNITKMFDLENEKEIKLSFTKSDFDNKLMETADDLGEVYYIIIAIKNLYDALFLKKIFNSSDDNIKFLSEYMIKRHDKHKKDLNKLKIILNIGKSKNEINNTTNYNKVFRSTNKDMCLYDKYVKNNIDYDTFKKDLIKILDDVLKESPDINKEYNDIILELEKEEFLPRIASTDNGRFPYQLNKTELIKIIENQGKYYKFLLDKANDGEYKLVKLLSFKIPYYVGPLTSSDKSNYAWMIKKENVKITPYNFEEIVDKEASAEKFITRMISHCTYLLDEPVLPNNSILYCKFKVMNELKQIKINNEKLSNEVQKDIFENLFKKETGTITERKFINYLNTTNYFEMYNGEYNIKGYSSDKEFANNMQSYIDFFGENGFFKDTNYTENDAEEIIKWITIFEDKDILEAKIKRNYKDLTDKSIKQLVNKKYSGWGNLSKKLLTEISYFDKNTSTPKNIINLMEETNENFMQIINNDKYNFQKIIKDNNKYVKNLDKLDYDVVGNLATSPQNKRGIYQSLKIVEELVNYMGYEPKNIMIEFARNDDVKKRTDNRKKYLEQLYEANKNTIDEYKSLRNELNKKENKDLSDMRLFLYFIQEGKCLYSGEKINIEELNDKNKYEIDHIIPRTLIKDNSIDNLALVLRKYNQDKKASYVLPVTWQKNQKMYWNLLKEHKLMSNKKYYNLNRREFKQEDIDGFINRQLVETRQITKHVANILENYYKKSNIIYLKADISHNYREKYDLFKFRQINDYHHAHDAYLAAVLGEYKEYYLKKELNYDAIKEMNNEIVKLDEGKRNKLQYGYVVNSLDENLFDIVSKISSKFVNEKTGDVNFNPKEFNEIVENTLYRNDILISRKSEAKEGKFYKETIYKRGVGTIPINKKMDVNIYGGYSNMETKNLMLIKLKDNYKIIGIPKYFNKHTSTLEIDNFINEQLNNKKHNEFEIIKNDIPFETEIKYKNQAVYITGYSVRNKNCEICNATQLKIPKKLYVKWKYALNYILKNNQKYQEDALKYIDDIYSFLLNINYYPLFESAIDKIKNNISFSELSLSDKQQIINELLNLFHCNSINANLSKYNLSDRIGRLSGINITSGTIITKSITGLKGNIYEFQNSSDN